jgi:hypothetical protein
MANKILDAGLFNFEVVGHSFAFSKNGYPQAILELRATERYLDKAEDLAQFGMDEPGYADWTQYDQELTDYLVLFNDTERFIAEGPDSTANFNYPGVGAALGWDGSSFRTLGDGTSFIGRVVGARVAEEEYQGKTNMKIKWIGLPNLGPASGKLRKATPEEIAVADSKLVTSKPRRATPAARLRPVATAAAAVCSGL